MAIKELVSECYHSLTAHQHQKGSYRAKTGDNDSNVNSSRSSLRTALCESIRYQAKSEQKSQTRPDTQGVPRGGCSLHPIKELEDHP